MINIGQVPDGWTFVEAQAGNDGGVAYESGEAMVVVHPVSEYGHWFSVSGRSETGIIVSAYGISRAPIIERLVQLLAIVAPHCPSVAEWLPWEAPCTPS
jgi:hypothetical protein